MNWCFTQFFFNFIMLYMAVSFHSWRNWLFMGVNQHPSVSNRQLPLMVFEPESQQGWASSFKERRLYHLSREARYSQGVWKLWCIYWNLQNGQPILQEHEHKHHTVARGCHWAPCKSSWLDAVVTFARDRAVTSDGVACSAVQITWLFKCVARARVLHIVNHTCCWTSAIHF